MPDFVVQKHRASTLHYDFRLEIGDVLKSWALPKGPSVDPAKKRLAIETEDHALTYIHFEGVIEEGYGAGEVIIWDRGSYSCAGDPAGEYEKGDIDFILEGEKLKGRFRLIRMDKWSGKNRMWLLIKRLDEHSSQDDITRTRPGSVVSLRRID